MPGLHKRLQIRAQETPCAETALYSIYVSTLWARWSKGGGGEEGLPWREKFKNFKIPKECLFLSIRRAPLPFARAQPPSPSGYPALKHSIRRYILIGKNPGWTQLKYCARLSLNKGNFKLTKSADLRLKGWIKSKNVYTVTIPVMLWSSVDGDCRSNT